jgi:histidinol dehydrogenase
MIKIYKYGEVSNEEIFARDNISQNVEAVVSEIIATVIREGDRALFEYSQKFDKATLDALEVTDAEIDEAYRLVEPEFIEIIKEAAENIRAFHSRQVREGFRIDSEGGIVTGQRITPIEKVGLYVPGGTAAYPSTVLMDSIPAKIAGCGEIVMVTPPSKEGKVNPVILAAAKIAGIDLTSPDFWRAGLETIAEEIEEFCSLVCAE